MHRTNLAVARGVTYTTTDSGERIPDLLRRLAADIEEEDWSLLSVDVDVDTEPPGHERLVALYEPLNDALDRMVDALDKEG